MKSTLKLYSTMFSTYPDVVNVDTMCEMLGGISRKLAYKLLSSQQINSFKAGREYRIPRLYVAEYCVGQLADLA